MSQMKTFYCFLFLVLFSCCSTDKNPTNTPSDADFSIFRLQDRSYTVTDIIDKDIDELHLAADPWLTSDDIAFYDYSTHCIYLKKTKDEFFHISDSISMNDQPFVVCANDERCYLGSFHSGALSLAPAFPYMDEFDINFYPEDVLHISKAWNQVDDVRNNGNIEDALRQLNLFHAGLSITLTSVDVTDNSDTATIQYSFKIKNNDKDNLYVIDPDKMGSALFHYYTNGVVLKNENEWIASYFKTVVAPEPFTSWNASWFVRINSGKSIQRTIQLKGYQHVPSGTYSCSMKYANPPKIDKEDRYLDDGRYWVGEIESPSITFTLD